MNLPETKTSRIAATVTAARSTPVATLKVLLVDDHPPVRQLVRDLLEDFSGAVQFEECGNGAEAVIAADRYQPDCILMDIQMPVLDGLQATARIKAQGIPRLVIILSSHDNAELRAAAQGAGADAYVLKDNLTGLLNLIRSLFPANS